TSGRRDVKFGYTKFADFFDNDRQTFDQLLATFRQFKNWPNWIVSTSVQERTNYFTGDECHKKFLSLTKAFYVSRVGDRIFPLKTCLLNILIIIFLDCREKKRRDWRQKEHNWRRAL